MMSVKDTPRFLTNEEIDGILEKVALPQISSSELRKHVHNQIKTMYKYQLEICKLKPSKIDKLTDYIANKSERSFFQPGSPIGFNVATAFEMTQLTLNAFHTAGQAKENSFDKFKKTISLRIYKKNAKDFSMKIHMNDKNYSYEDLYIKAQNFVYVCLDDLLLNNKIIKEEYPFEDTSMYTEDFKKLNNYKDYGYAIRLRFNTEKLFLYQIPIENIAMELEKIEGGKLFTVFYGPQVLGVIDIYPIPEGINPNNPDKNFKEDCQIFENGLLKSSLKNIFLGDYPEISSANVQKLPVISLIQDVTPDFDINPPMESKTRARVWINWLAVKKNGIPIEKLEKLLELTGYPVISTDPHGYYYVVESTDLNVKENINKILMKEDEKMINIFKETKKLTSSELYLTGYYNIIVTQGSNLAQIRNHPEVDEFNTISNSAMEIYEVLGLENCRSFLEKEISEIVIASGKVISPRNISILVDWMTANVRPISVNTKNVLKPDSSIIRSMSFENHIDNIVKGSVLSTNELVSNVSSKITFGVKQSMGTGAFSLEEDKKTIELYKTLTSEYDEGAYRITSETLKEASKSATTVSRGAIPEADSDLFSDLSKGSDIVFKL